MTRRPLLTALRRVAPSALVALALLLASCCEPACPWCIHPSKQGVPAAGNTPGDTVTYTISYQNATDVPVTMAIVDDYDQAHGTVGMVGGSSEFAAGTDDGDVITWGPAVVPPGTVGWVSYTYVLGSMVSFPVGSFLVENQATVNGEPVSAVIEVVRPAPPVVAGDGRLLVLADDWVLGNYFNRPGSDAETLMLNALNWLTEPVTGTTDTVLVDASYLDHGDLTPLLTALASNGYDVDVVPTSLWTPTLLANYAVAIVERAPAGYAAALTDFLVAGHGVWVIGGIDASPAQNEFLVPLGIEMQGHHTAVAEDTVTSFVADPVTAGVDTLFVMHPTPISLLGPAPVVLSQQYDDPEWLPGEPPQMIWLVALDLGAP